MSGLPSLRRPRARRALVAALLLAGALAAGCAAKPASTGPVSTGPSGGKIVLGFSAWPGWFPWQVAADEGLFAKNGVNVELKYFDSYTDSLNALATGSIDAYSQNLNNPLSSDADAGRQTIISARDNPNCIDHTQA